MRELLVIFWVFTKIGALTFGGGYSMLPMLRRECIDNKRWIDDKDLLDYYAIGQCTPGIIAVNTSILIGYRIKKTSGALAAALGVVFPSLAIILLIAAALSGFMDLPAVKHAFAGIRVVVAAMIIDAVIRQWKTAVKDKVGIVIFAAVLLVLLFTRISPIFIVFFAAASGIVTIFIRERRRNK